MPDWAQMVADADEREARQRDTDAKLSFLRQDAAHALRVYMSLFSVWTLGNDSDASRDEQINVAALGYVAAQAKYTLACHEAQQGSILDHVEVPT